MKESEHNPSAKYPQITLYLGRRLIGELKQRAEEDKEADNAAQYLRSILKDAWDIED